MKNITKRKSENCYCVVKTINGKVRTFGRFNDIEDAKNIVDEIEAAPTIIHADKPKIISF